MRRLRSTRVAGCLGRWGGAGGGGRGGRGGVGGGRGGLGGAGAGGELGVLALGEEGADLVGVEEAGQAEEVLFLGRAGRGRGAELAAVVEDPVEMRGRVERLEGGLVERAGGIALALGLLELFL